MRLSSSFVATVSLIAMTIMSGCAHHRDVRPGAEGVHRVITRGPEKEPAERDAISQANNYCEKFKKSAAFVEDNTKYTGSMSEENHKALRTASKAASAIGSGLSVFGGKNERGAGAVVGGTGMVGGVVTGGDAYTVDMRFKCQ